MNKTILFSLYLYFLCATITMVISSMVMFQPNGDGSGILSKFLVSGLNIFSTLLPAILYYVFYRHARDNGTINLNFQQVIQVVRLIFVGIGLYLIVQGLPIFFGCLVS
jgi:uncharacterized membrane-anchored protein